MQSVKIDRTKEWTVSDYLMLGEMNTPCQLINGELIMSPSPTTLHQRVSRKLFKVLDEYGNGFGEVFYAPIDLYVDNKNVFQPDLIYISKNNKHIVTHRGIEGVPDLVVEITSPSNTFYDRNAKKKKYLEFGVKEYWIVDPINQTLEIYLNNQPDPEASQLNLIGEGKVTSTVLPSLQFDLKSIF
jgi:Uma2 family endonuclease